MSRTHNVVSTLDGDLIGFEIRDGTRRIRCAVADEALEALSGLTLPSTAILRRRSFDRFRTLINAAAALKIATLPAGFIGPLVLTGGDLRRVPQERGSPAFGTSGRSPARSAAPVAAE